MRVTVCIPMYNESSIAAGCVRALYSACADFSGKTGDSYEVIFCDDGSSDDCADIVRREAEALGDAVDIRVVGYGKNRGKGSAVRTAFAASTGDVVLYTDCDLAYGTDVIGEAVEKMKNSDADVLIGSRNVSADGYEGYTFLRKLASKTYIAVLNLFAGFRLSDSQCGFKVFRGDAGRRIFKSCETDGFAFDIEALMIAGRLGYKVREMGVKVINHRESKVHVFSDTFKMLGDLRRIKKRVKKLAL